jgi:hypothetical protein
VVAADGLGELRIGADDDEAEGALELAQGAFGLAVLQEDVGPGNPRDAAVEPRALDALQRGRQQGLRQEHHEPHHQREGERQQDERDERGRHGTAATLREPPDGDKGLRCERSHPRGQRSTR